MARRQPVQGLWDEVNLYIHVGSNEHLIIAAHYQPYWQGNLKRVSGCPAARIPHNICAGGSCTILGKLAWLEFDGTEPDFSLVPQPNLPADWHRFGGYSNGAGGACTITTVVVEIQAGRFLDGIACFQMPH